MFFIGFLKSAAIWACIISTTAPASPVDPVTKHEERLSKLEDRVWLAEDFELHDVEHKIAREIQLFPRSAYAHYLMSLVLKRSFARDPSDLIYLKQSSQTAQQAVELAPDKDFGYIAMSDVLDLMGNGDKALSLLNNAEMSGLEPSWRFYFLRARLMADTADTGQIMGLLQTAMDFKNSHWKIITPYIVAILKSDYRGEKLIEKIKTWNKQYPSPLFDLTLAIELELSNKHIAAHKLYEKILKEYPENKEAAINDAVILYKHLGRSEKAIAQIKNVIKTLEKNSPTFVKSIANAHIGAAYLSLKKYKDAQNYFVKAVVIDPSNLNLTDFIAKSYRENKSDKELANFLKQLALNHSGSPVIYALLAEVLSEKMGKHDEAIEAFKDALVLDPEQGEYYTGMGLAYYRKKDFATALEKFQEASKIDPNDAIARYNEACVHSLMNNKRKALRKLQDALALDPRLTDNLRTDTDLDNIRSEPAFKEIFSEGAIAH